MVPLFILFFTVFPVTTPAMRTSGPGNATIGTFFQAPEGYTRISARPGSFTEFLRTLPLKPLGSPVMTYSGALKARQDVHAAVLGISVGDRDLQQCADAVMRLRAEYLYASGQQDRIAFNFTNGFRAEWSRWRKGERITVNGNVCLWKDGGAPNATHAELLRFLNLVFTYAGTLSLEKELFPVSGMPILPGDVFIHGGGPGHAVIVLDVARNAIGRSAFLLAQSYMPAQDIHVLRVPGHLDARAWYFLEERAPLVTPEWTFAWSERRRFP